MFFWIFGMECCAIYSKACNRNPDSGLDYFNDNVIIDFRIDNANVRNSW